MAKNPIFIQAFFFKSKILWHVLKKNIAWILQQVCKIPKDFGLHFKISKKKNILFFLICEIMNLYVRFILDIK
jgi:hypothetical protein